ILGLVTYLTSCQDWVDEKYVATLSKKYKYNIVGISGPQSVTPYIELRYCKVDEQGENVMVSEMVSSPFLMGGHEVNILCDSVIEIIGHSNNRSKSKATGKYRLILRHQYEETGAEYLRIINHSTDKSIEFFIAGAQEMKTNGSGCNGWGVIDVMPTIYYKHAPVYYLLFPERKYTQNLQGNSFDCSETFYFEGNRCGDLELDQAWSVEEVMALYRAEYNNSLDVMLYIDIHFDDLGRLNKAIDSGNPHVKYKRFYGVIMPGEKLKGGADTPLLATPSLFDDDL
ncbi:MAG: hypothetical protein LBF17_06520, partial [Mediterranea sp.]|nr:hypothetical protein [Mediterranea sp.]